MSLIQLDRYGKFCFWVQKNIETSIWIENYLTNYFMNSNIDFQSVCLGTILYSSTEIIDFSWQLYFFLVNFKSEIWQIYVIRRHHCQSTRGSYLPLLIFSYKGISILYYSMVITKIGNVERNDASLIHEMLGCI